MKTLKLAVLVALGSVLVTACTSSKDGESVDVTAETSNGDTSNNETADATDGDDESTQTSTTSDDNDEPDATDGADESTQTSTDSNDDEESDAGDSEISGEPDADVESDPETDAGACELPEAYPPTCEACLSDECNDQYLACYCDQDCAVQLEALGTCFGEVNSFDDPSEDPAADWDTCMNAIGGDDASPLLFDLLDCVGEYYEPPVEDAEDDPYGRVEGDSQCSAACFSLYTFADL